LLDENPWVREQNCFNFVNCWNRQFLKLARTGIYNSYESVIPTRIPKGSSHCFQE